MVESRPCLPQRRIRPIGIFAGTVARQRPLPGFLTRLDRAFACRVPRTLSSPISNHSFVTMFGSFFELCRREKRRQRHSPNGRASTEMSARHTLRADAISCLSAAVSRPSSTQHSSTAPVLSSAMPRSCVLPAELSFRRGKQRAVAVVSKRVGSRGVAGP